MFSRRCGTALEIVWNEGATHGTFDPGWDNHRTFKTPVRGGLHGTEYKANVRASYANVAAIERFLTQTLAMKAAAGTSDRKASP